MIFNKHIHEDDGYEYGVVEQFKDKDGTKNIVISFDGTGGSPGWAVQPKPAEVPLYEGKTGLSNICKMHLYAGGNVGNTTASCDGQVALYYSGVGTRGNYRFLKANFGLGAMADIYTMAYEDLEKIYKEGDKLYVFGFSRGAATARLFCSYLYQNPIGKETNVDFLGVYDTVAESVPIFGGVGTSDVPQVLDKGENGSLPPNVAKAVHFVSLDDYRAPFAPTLFNKDDRVTEVWVPGNHSDVGGGYYHDGISDIVLKCMMMKAKEAGMKTRDITEKTCKEEINTLIDVDDPEVNTEQFSNFDNDMEIRENALDPDVHNEVSGLYKFINYINCFSHRPIRKLKDGKTWEGEPILLLDIVVKRAKEWNGQIPEEFNNPEKTYSNNKYRPSYLVGIPYKLVTSKDMSVSETVTNCITDEVSDW